MNFKSLFVYTSQQRKGIFLLLLLILALQCLYAFVDFSSEEPRINQKELKRYMVEIDSLKTIEFENRKPKIYPFNPNFITDYKGYTLGMKPAEIDRLHIYREQDRWVNSAKEFQQVTKVSDSLLEMISPYFKFPEWVTQTKPKLNSKYAHENIPKTEEQKIDLNVATMAQLQKVYGVGEKLSQRIVNYRDKHKGLISLVELSDVYGLSPEVIANVGKKFKVVAPRIVEKINLNDATIEELVTIKHIDYEIAHNVIEQRTLREGYESLEELKKVKDFPIKKIEIIRLYLTL